MSNHFFVKIKEIFEYDRPRERLMSFGALSLSDAELLAIILQTGSGKDNAVDLSHRLIKIFGLKGVFEASINELLNVKGIGKAKACKIISCFEIIKRANSGRICERKVSCAADIGSYYVKKLSGLKKEHLIVVMLDSKGCVIKDELVSVGTLNSSLVHAREVFSPAIKFSANSIILVHNHPSGNCEPSEEDIYVTKKLKKASESIGISLLDHIIVGNDRYWSYKDG